MRKKRLLHPTICHGFLPISPVRAVDGLDKRVPRRGEQFAHVVEQVFWSDGVHFSGRAGGAAQAHSHHPLSL